MAVHDHQGTSPTPHHVLLVPTTDKSDLLPINLS
jgi:hypothetical protein